MRKTNVKNQRASSSRLLGLVFVSVSVVLLSYLLVVGSCNSRRQPNAARKDIGQHYPSVLKLVSELPIEFGSSNGSTNIQMRWSPSSRDLLIATRDDIFSFDPQKDVALKREWTRSVFSDGGLESDGVFMGDTDTGFAFTAKTHELSLLDLKSFKPILTLGDVHGFQMIGPEVLFVWTLAQRKAGFWSLSPLSEIPVFPTENEVMDYLKRKSGGFAAFESTQDSGIPAETTILTGEKGSLYASGTTLLLKDIQFEIRKKSFDSGWQWSWNDQKISIVFVASNVPDSSTRREFKSYSYGTCSISQSAGVAIVGIRPNRDLEVETFQVFLLDLNSGRPITAPVVVTGGVPVSAAISEKGDLAAVAYGSVFGSEQGHKISVFSVERNQD